MVPAAVSMLALTTGCCLSASTVASAKNGRKDSFTPSRDSNSALATSRSRATRVTSTSTTVVSWAAVCSDSTIRDAKTPRSRDIFSVRPRSALAAAAVLGTAVLAACEPGDGTGAAACLAASAAAMTSCLRMRPPTPVPVRLARSMPCSPASLRTSGVT